MKRFLHTTSTLLFVLAILFASPQTISAGEEDSEHQPGVEVNGYHVTLSSQNEWVKGENVLVVTITDSMDMPVRDAKVEILVAPKESGHGESETDSHDNDQQDAMPGMNMGDSAKQVSGTSVHDEESASPIAMMESEHGMYTVQSHLESAGEYEVHVMFHADGEMLQADFVVNVTGSSSKTVVLWSFAAINVAIIAAAGALKKQQPLTVKGGR